MHYLRVAVLKVVLKVGQWALRLGHWAVQFYLGGEPKARQRPMLVMLPRQGGKTRLLAEWARMHDGVVVCWSAYEAARVEREYGVDTLAVPALRPGNPLPRRPIALDNWPWMARPQALLDQAWVVSGGRVLASMDPLDETFEVLTPGNMGGCSN